MPIFTPGFQSLGYTWLTIIIEVKTILEVAFSTEKNILS